MECDSAWRLLALLLAALALQASVIFLYLFARSQGSVYGLAAVFGVAYGSDLEKVRNALVEVARENSHVLPQPEPTVFLETFGEISINLELVVWSKEMSYRPRRFRSDLNFAIAQKLREAGIEIPWPQRDLHFRDGVVRVEMTASEKTRERAVADGA